MRHYRKVVESRDCRSQWNERTVGVGSTRENSGSTREMLDIENLKALLIQVTSRSRV